MPTSNSLPHNSSFKTQFSSSNPAFQAKLEVLGSPEVQAVIGQMINDAVSFALGDLELLQFKRNVKTFQQSIFQHRQICPGCAGFGYLDNDSPCKVCAAKGWIWDKTRPITPAVVVIPTPVFAGAQQMTTSQLRLLRNADTHGRLWAWRGSHKFKDAQVLKAQKLLVLDMDDDDGNWYEITDAGRALVEQIGK